MNRTFSDILLLLSSYFPQSLLSESGLNHLLKTTEKFPSLISPTVAFETKLSEESAFLDMFLGIAKKDRSLLVGSHPEIGLKPGLYSHNFWKNTIELGNRWVDAGSLWDQYLQMVIFEFDVGDVSQEIPIPALFLQISEKMYQSAQRQLSLNNEHFSSSNYQWIIDTISQFNSSGLGSKTIENIDLCFGNLNSRIFIDHVGFMASRIPAVVRINITNLNLDLLFNYLDDINIDFPIHQIEQCVSNMFQFVDHMVLALDVGEKIYPKLGIEFRMPKEKLNLNTQSQWFPFLDYLVEHDYCTENKKEGLKKWIGRSREIYDPELYKYYIYIDI